MIVVAVVLTILFCCFCGVALLIFLVFVGFFKPKSNNENGNTSTTIVPPSNTQSNVELTDWTTHVDPESGEKYYYNETTGESQWEN